jgi:hypothetical protein
MLVLLLCCSAGLTHVRVFIQINFAESSLECRRMLIMRWFGENDFTPEQCSRRCDVCRANAEAGVLRPEGEAIVFESGVRSLGLMSNG